MGGQPRTLERNRNNPDGLQHLHALGQFMALQHRLQSGVAVCFLPIRANGSRDQRVIAVLRVKQQAESVLRGKSAQFSPVSD